MGVVDCYPRKPIDEVHIIRFPPSCRCVGPNNGWAISSQAKMSMFEAAAEELQSLASPSDLLEMDATSSDSTVTLGMVTKPGLIEGADDSDKFDMGTKGIEKAAPSPRSLPSPLNEMVEEAEPDVAEVVGEGEGTEAQEAAAAQGPSVIEEATAVTEATVTKAGEGMETLTLGEEGEDAGVAQGNAR